jgi:hypothetical protein
LQLTVDLCPFGTRLLFWQVRVTVQRHGEIFDLAAEQPEPPFSVHCAGPVLQLARVDRHENLIPRQAVLSEPSCHSASRPWQTHSPS